MFLQMGRYLFYLYFTHNSALNEKAQKDFEEGKKVDEWVLRYRKECVRERIEQNKQMSSDVKEGMETTKKSGYKHISRSPVPDKGRGGMGD